MKMIFTHNDIVMVKKIGCLRRNEYSHVGITDTGKLFVFCFVNNNGTEYNSETDGPIKFD